MSDKHKSLFSARVLRSEKITPSCSLVVLERPDRFPDADPGQFISVRTTASTVPLLRRPYSIMDLYGGELSLLVKVVGTGSALIAGAVPGGKFEIVGPFGSTSFIPPATGKAVFVAGGTGLAPMIFASRRWGRDGTAEERYLVHGASTEQELLDLPFQKDFTGTFRSTIDGSSDFKGDVISLLELLAQENDLPLDSLYSCGPRGMIEGLVKRLGKTFGTHQTSLESVMACGVGACRGCTVPVITAGGTVNRTVCDDGTVFMAEEIDWEAWEE